MQQKMRAALVALGGMLAMLFGTPAAFAGLVSDDGTANLQHGELLIDQNNAKAAPNGVLAWGNGVNVATTSRFDLEVIDSVALKRNGGSIGGGRVPIIDARALDEQHRPVAVINDVAWPVDYGINSVAFMEHNTTV